MADDIFSEMMGAEQGAGAPQEPEPFLGPEVFEEELPEPQAAPEDKSSRYYQSLYDKTQAEVGRLAQQNQLLMEQIRMAVVQQGGQPPVNPAQPQGGSAASPVRPERPTRPQGYDPIDATTDPSSPSWKYREAMEVFPEQMAEYMEQIQGYATRQVQEMSQRQAEAARIGQIRGQLVQTYGMSDQEAQEFWRTMNDPESLNLDNLVKLFRLNKGQSVPTNPRSRSPLPPVPVVRGGGTQAQGSVEDRIMDDMVRISNRSNPF